MDTFPPSDQGFIPEDVANKSAVLVASDTAYPTNDAVIDFVNDRIPGALTYYLQNTASDVEGYKQDLQAIAANKADISITPGNGTHVLGNWITDPNLPGLDFIPAGGYMFHIHASRASGPFSVYAEFWEADAAGADIGASPIGTSEVGVVGTSETEFQLAFVLPNPYTMQSRASRIVCRIYAITSSGATCHLYVGGEADSHLSLPSNSVDASTFVPYIVKTDTGDPATGSPAMICINTFDENVKIYAGGAWRLLFDWSLA